ncbi:hypothetical protein ACFXHA_31705 [Nocardia sp. NPDC059240]|uniref:hypothetical protein n=1 Tax=Nocardia sp. NPDC059240 TaxID=3346786 RepID=UPI00368D1761
MRIRPVTAALGRVTAALAAGCLTASILTAGVAYADPDDPAPDPGSQLCPYPDVNNPDCTQFNDDHNSIGPGGNDSHDHDHDR